VSTDLRQLLAAERAAVMNYVTAVRLNQESVRADDAHRKWLQAHKALEDAIVELQRRRVDLATGGRTHLLDRKK
jgi:hypothetical protein